MTFLPSVRVVRAQNAREGAYARNFLKCSKWPQTCAKQIWGDFEQFKFLRAHWRADVRVRARSHVRNWPFCYCSWPCSLWTRNDLSLRRYDNVQFFTKWRLDDVTMTCWPWKVSRHFFVQVLITVRSLKKIDPAEFEFSVSQKSVRNGIKINKE